MFAPIDSFTVLQFYRAFQAFGRGPKIISNISDTFIVLNAINRILSVASLKFKYSQRYYLSKLVAHRYAANIGSSIDSPPPVDHVAPIESVGHVAPIESVGHAAPGELVEH